MLRWASAYIIITPLFGIVLVKLLNKIREDGGLSKVLRSVLYRARQKPHENTKETWDPKTKTYKSNPKVFDPSVNLYKDIIKENEASRATSNT